MDKRYFLLKAQVIIRFLERKFLNLFPDYLFLPTKLFTRLFYEMDLFFLPRITGKTILDIGTGLAPYPRKFAKERLNVQMIVGMDISGNLLRKAQELARDENIDNRMKFVRADAHALSFSDNAFDCIISIGSLNLWSRPLLVLNEAYRVLKPGGKFFLLDQCRAKSIKEIKEALFERGFFGIGLVAYSEAEIQRFVQKSTFKDCNMKVENMVVYVEMKK